LQQQEHRHSLTARTGPAMALPAPIAKDEPTMSSMPHPDHARNDPTGEEIVLGVDTHKDIHVAAVVTGLGAHLADATFPTTVAGYRQLLAWARGFGPVVRAGVEGTGSYGAALTRYLRAGGITVIEVNRPDRAARRHGKTDTIDAIAAARAVLTARATAVAKTGDGPVEILRLLRLAGPRRSRPGPRRSTSSRPSSSAPTRSCATP
jgi:transposase